MDKTKVTLSMNVEKVKELKKKAIDAGVTLSDYLAGAGTITSIPQIQKYQNNISAVGAPPMNYVGKNK